MVESTALEMRRAREGTQGSNPCLSASHAVRHDRALELICIDTEVAQPLLMINGFRTLRLRGRCR